MYLRGCPSCFSRTSLSPPTLNSDKRAWQRGRWHRILHNGLLVECNTKPNHGLVAKSRSDTRICQGQATVAVPPHRTGSRICFCGTRGSRISKSPTSARLANGQPPRGNQKRKAFLSLPHRHLPAPTRLSADLHNGEMQPTMSVLHAGGGGPSVAAS